MPSFTTRSYGTKILVYPAISSVQSDYAIGIESGYMWQSVPTTAANMGFVWYGGISQILKLTSVLLTCPAALSVGTTSTFNGTMTVNALNGQGGTIRVMARNHGNESSVDCYNYIDLRIASAGDAWVFGSNCWGAPANVFSIGTPGKNACLSIGVDGVVALVYKLRTPELLVNTIRGNGEHLITIDDNVIISNALSTPVINTNILRVGNYIESSGQVYESVSVLNATNNTVLTYSHIRGGIITCLNTANGLTLTLPTGTAINGGMIGVGYNQSFKWSVINLSSSTGNVGILASSGHTCVGNYTLTTDASYRF
jgi:hypothetical protein